MKQVSTILHEGMREGDLVDLVLPLISVDEYESKVDAEEAVVIGFYVHAEDAARDLNRFLQKSANLLLGTEVSPAPDQFGYYIVFVEIMNNERLAETVSNIFQELEALVDLKEEDWQMRIRGSDDLRPYSPEELRAGLKKAAKHSKKIDVIECLRRSTLHNAEFSDTVLVLEGSGDRFALDFVDFAPVDQLLHDFGLHEQSISCDIRSMARSNRFKRMLGENWEASKIGQFIILHSHHDNRGILLRS